MDIRGSGLERSPGREIYPDLGAFQLYASVGAQPLRNACGVQDHNFHYNYLHKEVTDSLHDRVVDTKRARMGYADTKDIRKMRLGK